MAASVSARVNLIGQGDTCTDSFGLASLDSRFYQRSVDCDEQDALWWTVELKLRGQPIVLQKRLKGPESPRARFNVLKGTRKAGFTRKNSRSPVMRFF